MCMTSEDKYPSRILFPFVGDTIGGSHLSALELINGLDRSLFEPVIAVHQDGMLVKYLKEREINYICLSRISIKNQNKVNILFFILKMAYFIRKNNIKIVHTNDGKMHPIWQSSAQIARIPYVRHQRTCFKVRNQNKQNKLNIGQLLPQTAKKIITISECCKNSLPPEMNHNSQIIMNPFNTKLSLPNRLEEREKLLNDLDCPLNYKIVGFVSNLIDYKRPQIFIEMASIICESGIDDIIFPMFGDKREPFVNLIEEEIKSRGLEKKCILMGPRFPIEPLMSTFDVLVAPAVKEAFGRTIVESMLVGTPVVAAEKGGHKEIIHHNDTGLLVEPDNPYAFADSVINLLENPELATKISESARLWASKNCSVEKHVEAVQEIYLELIK